MLLAILLLCLLVLSPALGKNRLHRRFDHRNGLENAHVTALTQDAAGFLWIGMLDELLRFDGLNFRRWNRQKLGKVDALAYHPDFGVLVLDERGGKVLRTVKDGLIPVFAEQGSITHFDVGLDGTVWLINGDDQVGRRDRNGRWTHYAPKTFGGDIPWRIFPSRQGGAHVATYDGLWYLDTQGQAERLLQRTGEKRVAEHANGAVYLTHRGNPSELMEIRDGAVRTIFRWEGRPVTILTRGDDLWFSGGGLYRYRPGEDVETVNLGYDDAVPMSPHLLVDRENSLWLGGFDGLVQMPEPNTVSFTPQDGLPPAPAWSAPARTEEGLWTSGWNGLGLIRTSVSGATAADSPYRGHTPAHLCVDARNRLWTFEGLVGILERANGRFRTVRSASTYRGDCAPSKDGRIWFFLDDRLVRTPEGYGPLEEMGSLPIVPSIIKEVGDEVWLGGPEVLWKADRFALEHGGEWVREDVPGLTQVRDFHSMPSGVVWAASAGGLFRRGISGKWSLVLGVPHRTYYGIFDSPSGGFWLTSTGSILRVAERPDSASGVEILETLTMWQGMTESWNLELLEEDDGMLWIASPVGVIRMPPSSRFSPRPVPNVALVDVRVDGDRVSSEGLELPFAKNRLELHFAALSYRDPALIRYRVRSHSGERWIETHTPNFQFTNLEPGIYTPEVMASLDGEHWSPTPASLVFRVLPPWYRTGWAMALFVFLLAAMVFLLVRIRLAVAERLERQRTRIAMDLHDEMGAGLGSIGILASLIDGDVPAEKRRELVEKIVGTANELGGSLRDLLWSLRTPDRHLEALASHLMERAVRFFPDEPVQFRTAFPKRWPSRPLSLSVRRNLQKIALEAMHNAARHADATDVELGFGVTERCWRMWISDNGKGLPEESETVADRGIGLEAMRIRTEQIGGKFRVLPGRDGGTRVEIEFRPDAEDRRVRRRFG